MDNDRFSKCTLLGELFATRPQHGPHKRWRDVVVDNFKRIHPSVAEKVDTAQDHLMWREIIHCRLQPRDFSAEPEYCCARGKMCRRPGDLKRYKPFCQFMPI